MDIIAAVLREVKTALGEEVLSDAILQHIEQKVRAAHGGRTVRVAVATEAEQINRIRDKARRNQAIKRAMEDGCGPAELRERFGLSRSQLYNLAKDGY